MSRYRKTPHIGNEQTITMTKLEQQNWDIIIAGGGPAGFFAAIRCADAARNPKLRVLIIEKASQTLGKVLISGGVKLKEVDFKTMQSRVVENLFFAGEVLDIDGITGGFNFQSSRTTGWLAGNALAE